VPRRQLPKDPAADVLPGESKDVQGPAMAMFIWDCLDRAGWKWPGKRHRPLWLEACAYNDMSALD
jgi:hypothetical protein